MREKWIDNAKGIAIILVILAHVDSRFSFAYGFHLVVFFVLSGYTFKIEPITKQYLNKKYKRLMVPYFYTCTAIAVTDIINDYLIFHDASIKTITKTIANDLIRGFFASGSIENFGSIDVGGRIGAIWFLPALFFALVFFQAICPHFREDWTLGITTGTIAVVGMISARFIWLPFSIQSGMFAMPFICVGYIIKKRSIINRLKWQHYLFGLIILLIGIKAGYCALWFVSASPGDVLLSPVVGLAGCMMVFLIAMQYKGKLLAYLGRISLSILCAHLYTLECMGTYFWKAIEIMGVEGESRTVLLILMELVFPIVIAIVIEKHKECCKNRVQRESSNKDRDGAIDVARGILILSMIIGNYSIDSVLRSIIFSCHMVAFIVFSGYFYKKDRDVSSSIKHMINGLIKPYLVAAILFVAVSYKSWDMLFLKNTAIKYLAGMSYSKRILTNVDSVGPVYFILLLFVVRMLYMAIDKITNTEAVNCMLVISISLFGVICGAKGYWLPWSFDVACYSLIFYKIGVLLRENDRLTMIKSVSCSYFLLTPVWAYMIFSGSMEITIRNYGQYGLTILGATAGSIVVYMLSGYIWDNMSKLGVMMALLGKSCIYILIVHTIMGGIISNTVTQRFDPEYFPFMVLNLTAQIAIAVVAYCVGRSISNVLRARVRKI